jgi:hypothetical protein
VILHTVVSHLPEPASAVSEAARVAKPGGSVGVFDGDYASLTIHTGHPDDKTVLQAIRNVSSANHDVMRSVPEIMKQQAHSIKDIDASVLVTGGESPFFGSLVTTYVPLAVESGELNQDMGRSFYHSFESARLRQTPAASAGP